MKTDKLVEKVITEWYNEGNRKDMGDLARRAIEAGKRACMLETAKKIEEFIDNYPWLKKRLIEVFGNPEEMKK